MYLFLLIEYFNRLFFTIWSLYDKPKKAIQQYPEKDFYEKEFAKFRLYESTEHEDPCLKNRTIESFYYDIKEYTSIFQDPNNDHESGWKRKILYMTTPLGNIVMYYDPYKMGFSYYADQSMPYNILNAVAMRYVRIFQCMDFFMDEIVTNRPSPLIDVHKKEVPKSTENTKLKISIPLCFNRIKKGSKEPVTIITCRNTFISLGKMRNVSFLQSNKKGKQLPKFTSNLLQNVETQANTQKQRLTYKDFMETKRERN